MSQILNRRNFIMKIFDQEGLLEEVLANPSKFISIANEFPIQSRLTEISQKEGFSDKPLPSSLQSLRDKYRGLAQYKNLREKYYKRTREPNNSVLNQLMAGSLGLKDKISPLAVQMPYTCLNELKELMEITELAWSVINYISLEATQEKILAVQCLENKIELLLHLARLRGGISDLVEILALQISDDYQINSSIQNTLSRLKDTCFKQIVGHQEQEYESQPVEILYKIPLAVSEIAWNGTHLYYLIAKQGAHLVKCVGDIKKIDFGREISSVTCTFDGQVKLAASETRIFCVDRSALHIFDENMILQQKISSPDFKTADSISCSGDGSVAILSNNNIFFSFRFDSNTLKYVQKMFKPNFLTAATVDSVDLDKEAFLLIQEDKRMQLLIKYRSCDFDFNNDGSFVSLRRGNVQKAFGQRNTYNPCSNQIIQIQESSYQIREVGHLLKSKLQKTQFLTQQDKKYNDFFGCQIPPQVPFSVKDLKLQVRELILEMQVADLRLNPSEKTLNYIVSHKKRVYEQLIATKNIEILHLNLKMLQRQGLSLNAIARSDKFEYEMLLSLKDDEPNLLIVWPYMEYTSINQFRQQFPQLQCVSKSHEELTWEQLSLFANENIIPEDGQSFVGDIIRINIGQEVTRKEFQDQSILLAILFSEQHGPSANYDLYDGILSGGLASTSNLHSYSKVLKAIKLSQKGPLVNYGGEKALLLTETTFLAIVSLVGLNSELQQADDILDDGPANEMIEAFKLDVDLHHVFNQLWLRACQIKVHFVKQKSQLVNQAELADPDQALNTLVKSINDKCFLLQKLNVPLLVQNQQRGVSQVSRVQSSFENEQLAAQLGINYKQWKQKLLNQKDDLNEKAEAVARSVLKCLQNPCQPQDLSNYLEQASQLSEQRNSSLNLLLKGANTISQQLLQEYISLVIDFKFSPNGEKYSYVVRGANYEAQTEIQKTLFEILRTLSQRCKSKAEFSAFLRLIQSLKFTARDFRPMLKELDIFNLLYGIEGSQPTITDVFSEILLRLYEEKDLSTDGLRRCVSRIDFTTSNQLLGSQVALIINEIEGYIVQWALIQKEGPITKNNFQKLALRYTNDLIEENLVEMDFPENDLGGLFDDEEDKQSFKLAPSSAQIEKAKQTQQKQLFIASDHKFRDLTRMLDSLCNRFDTNPQLLHLLTQPNILKTLLSSLAVLGTVVGTQIVQILISVCTHSSRMPTDLLDVSCESIWPEIQVKVSCKGGFTRYLLGLATHIADPEQSNIRADSSDFCQELLRLAATRPSLALLENFLSLSESDQIQALEVYRLSLHFEYVGELKSDLINAVEGLLNLKTTARVRALVLQLLIKGKLQKARPETVAFLSCRSLFSTFETYSPNEISNQLKHLYSIIEPPVPKTPTQTVEQKAIEPLGPDEDTFLSLFDTSLEPAPKTDNTEWKAQLELDQICEMVAVKGRELKVLAKQLLKNNSRPIFKSLHKRLSPSTKVQTNSTIQEQVFKIIENFCVPPELLLRALTQLDASLQQKIDYFSTQAPHKTKLLTFLLKEFIGSLSEEQQQQAKFFICKVLLEYEHEYRTDILISEKVEISDKKPNTNWIQSQSKQKLEQDWIDILSQTLLFSQQPENTNALFLHIAAKHYRNLLAIECQTGDKVQSQIAQVDYEHIYKNHLKHSNQQLVSHHIFKQISEPVTDYELKFRHLVLYAGLKSVNQNKQALQGLAKLMIDMFVSLDIQLYDEERLKDCLHKMCRVVSSLPKDFQVGAESKKALENYTSPHHPHMNGYQKLHLKVAFANQEDLYRDKFGSCIAFLKDFEARRFGKLFQRYLPGEGPKDETELQIFNKNYSADLLHRVQKVIRSGNPFVSEFGENSEELTCAGYIQKIIEKFNSPSFQWLATSEKKILAEDTVHSQIRDLAVFSTCLIKYQDQEFDFGNSPQRKRGMEELRFDRHVANQFKESGNVYDGKDSQQTLFTQLQVNLDNAGGIQTLIRENPDDRAFFARFMSEGSYDSGGPYRELFDSICTELMSPVLPVLIPTPNQSSEFGDLRNCWMLNFACEDEKMFEFFGALVGYAIRSTSPLLLDLHPIVWKQINNTKLTEEDLRSSDLYRYQMLDYIRKVEKQEDFEHMIEQNFTIVLTNGTQKDLVENGANVRVTFENRMKYIQLATHTLLHVADQQAAWVRSGVEIVCGKVSLAQLHWRILEERACGPANIDISYLKLHTENEGVDQGVEEMFWKVLESFNQSELVKYLQFVCGRGKLPIDMGRLDYKHKINPLGDGGDEVLPLSHTCFFTIDLPTYSSFEVFRRNLLIAITFCSTIDGDRDIFNDEEY